MVEVLLDELASNVVAHGVGPDGVVPSIEIGVFSCAGRVAIEMADDGPGFDPLSERFACCVR